MTLYTDFDPDSPPTTFPDDQIVIVEAEDVPGFLSLAGSKTLAVSVGDSPHLPSVADRSGDFDAAVDRAVADDTAADVSPTIRVSLAANQEPRLPDAVAALIGSAVAARAEARPAFVEALHHAALRYTSTSDALGIEGGLGRSLVRASRGELSDEDHASLFSVSSLTIVGQILAEAGLTSTHDLRLLLGTPIETPSDVHPLVWALEQSGFSRRSMSVQTRGSDESKEGLPSSTFVDADGVVVRIESDTETGDTILGPVRRPGESALSNIAVHLRREGKVVSRFSDDKSEFSNGERVRIPAVAFQESDEILIQTISIDR